mgnify:FL=1
MPTPTWQRLDESRRQAITDAAEAEFAANGFSGGSLNVIARDAGVAKGSLFQYFTDKADFYVYLSELASNRIRSYMEVLISEQDWTGDFWGSFENLLQVWTDYFIDNPIDKALTAAVNLEPDASARIAVRSAVNHHYLDVLRPLLESAAEDGWIRSDADIDAGLSLLLMIMPHLALAPGNPGVDPVLGLDSDSDEVRQEAVRRLLSMFRQALEPATAG